MSAVTPWWNRIPAILKYPFNIGGVIALGVMSVAAMIQALSRYGAGGILGKLIASGLVFAIVFLVIRKSANGAEEFPDLSQIEDPFDDVFVPGIKVSALGFLLYLPMFVCLFNAAFAAVETGGSLMMRGQKPPAAWSQPAKGRPAPRNETAPPWVTNPGTNPWAQPATNEPDESDVDEETAKALFGLDPTEEAELTSGAVRAASWFFGAVIAGVVATVVYPLCLIVLAMSGSILMALFPLTWFQIVKQVPLGYLGLLGVLGLGTALSFCAGVPASFVPVPVLPSLAAAIFRMYLMLCGAHLLGWFVYQNRERLGIAEEPVRRDVSVTEVKAMAVAGQQGQMYRPAGAGVVRVGTAPAAAPGPLAPGEVPGGPPMPAATDGGVPAPPWGSAASAAPEQPAQQDSEIAGLHARFQSACASRDLAAVQQSAPLLVDAYWQAGQPAGATQVYRSLIAVSPETSLGPERQGRLAKELELEGDLATAMTAWRTLALAHPDHPRAPSALWRCAEVCQKMQRPDWVAGACQAILARYPMSEVAPLAQQRLKQLQPKA